MWRKPFQPLMIRCKKSHLVNRNVDEIREGKAHKQDAPNTSSQEIEYTQTASSAELKVEVELGKVRSILFNGKKRPITAIYCQITKKYIETFSLVYFFFKFKPCMFTEKLLKVLED